MKTASVFSAAQCAMVLCWFLVSSGCAKAPNLVDRIRSGDRVKQVTFGAQRNQSWVQVGLTLTNAASLDCLSRQIASCRKEALTERYYEARFVLSSGYTEKVIFMVQPEASRFCIGVDFGPLKDPDFFVVQVPPDAPEDLRKELSFLAHPNGEPVAGEHADR